MPRRESFEENFPQIEYPEASPMPQMWRTYTLDAGPQFKNWQFTCQQPDMKEWAKAMKTASPIFDAIGSLDEAAGGRLTPSQVVRYFQKFGEVWEDVARVAAQVVVSWNFRDADGTPLPQPFRNVPTILKLPAPIARPFGMEVLNFLAWASGGEEEGECLHCGATVMASWLYCPECGERTEMRCPECRRVVEAEWRVCPTCGSSLGDLSKVPLEGQSPPETSEE